ncbi:MAG: hypothetical protein J6J20_02195 [Muribaculaceae bacterium]|nr:hypothetical protein [Muribaculaceae bacterium]
MTDLGTITVNVNLRLVGDDGLLAAILRGAPAAPSQAPAEASSPIQAPAPSDSSGKSDKSDSSDPSDQSDQSDTPTEADVRAAIEQAQTRILGEDWMNHRDSDHVRRYYQPLREQFIRIAESLMADRPSRIAPERRAAFIREAGQLEIDGDRVTIPCPY